MVESLLARSAPPSRLHPLRLDFSRPLSALGDDRRASVEWLLRVKVTPMLMLRTAGPQIAPEHRQCVTSGLACTLEAKASERCCVEAGFCRRASTSSG